MKKGIYLSTSIGVNFITIISFFMTIFLNTFPKYEMMWILPLVFLFCFNFSIRDFLIERFSFFRITISIILFLRYVVLPLIIVLANYDHTASVYRPTVDQTEYAIYLMGYELIAYSIVFKIFGNYKIDGAGFERVKYSNSIVVLFILFSLCLFLIFPGVVNYFSFVTVNSSINNTNYSNLEQITILCVVCTKGLIFLATLDYFSKRYHLTKLRKYFIYGILAAIVNSCFYYGANRSTFIFLSVASFTAFYAFYRTGLRQIFSILFIVVLVIVPIITSYRNYYDYYSHLYGIQKVLVSYQGLINEYFGGINNVAIGLETANIFPDNRTFINLVYDFARPFVGFNVLLKDLGIDYSNLYFNYCYHRSDLVSVIFPTVAQGYFYFGFLGAPILGVILILIALYIEKCCLNGMNPYFLYFLTPSLFRLGTLTGANVNIQMNDLSLKVIVPVLLYILVKYIKKKRFKLWNI